MMGVLLVHYLDIVRHFLSFAIQPFNWITNITASIVTFIAISLFWPKARRAYKTWFESHIKSLHEKLDTQHAEHLATLERHHREHLSAIKSLAKPASPAKPAPPRKPTGGATK